MKVQRRLRLHQWEEILQLTRYLAVEKRVGYIGGTGIGKSTVSQLLAYRMVKQGKVFEHVLVLTPLDILRAAFRRSADNDNDVWHPPEQLESAYPVHGGIFRMPSWSDLVTEHDFQHQPFCRTTYQYLLDKPDLVDKLDLSTTLVLADEAGLLAGEDGNQFARLISRMGDKGATILLMTATPFRADGWLVLNPDTTPCVVRSLADQAAAGLAPQNWDFSAFTMKGCPPSPSWKQMKEGARSIFEEWRRQGRPVSVIRTPTHTGDSRMWQRALTEVFSEDLAPENMLKAVGKGKRHQMMVTRLLEEERKRIEGGSPFDEWKIRVVFTAKRFDLGSDLPSVSAVFHIGPPPGSLPHTIQVFGRATRGKHGFAEQGFPPEFQNKAQLIFALFDMSGVEVSPAVQREHQKNWLLVIGYLGSLRLSARIAETRHALRRYLMNTGLTATRAESLTRPLNSVNFLTGEECSNLHMLIHREALNLVQAGRPPRLKDVWKAVSANNTLTEREREALSGMIHALSPNRDNITKSLARRATQQGKVKLYEALDSVLEQMLGDDCFSSQIVFTKGTLEFVAEATHTSAYDVSRLLLGASEIMITDEEVVELDTAWVQTHNVSLEAAKPDAIPFKGSTVSYDQIQSAVLNREGSRVRLGVPQITSTRFRRAILGPPITRGAILRALSQERVLPPVTASAIIQWALSGTPDHLVTRAFGPKDDWVVIDLALQRGWRGLDPGQCLRTLEIQPPWGRAGAPSPVEIEAAVASFVRAEHRQPGYQDRFTDVAPHWSAPRPDTFVWGDFLRLMQKQVKGSTRKGAE